MKSYFTNYNKTPKLLTIALSFVLFSVASNASAKDNQKSAETIMMCTFPQEILKAKSLKAMSITYMNEEVEKRDASKSLDKALKSLKKEKFSKKLHKKVVRLASSWVKTEKKINKGIKQKSVSVLYRDVYAVDKSCLDVANLMVNKKYSIVKSQIATLNLYIHQLNTLYIIKAWDAISDKEYKSTIKKIIANYEKINSSLAKNKKISKAMRANLEKMDKVFTTFKFMTTSTSGRYMPILAEKKASDIDMLTKTILEGK